MKTTDLTWKVAGITLLVLILAALLIFGIMILKRVNRCCDCDKSKVSKETVLILRTAEVYDSLTHQKGTRVWIDTLSFGEKGNSSLTIWNPCPEKETPKVSSIVKKSSITQLTKKVTKSTPSVKEEPKKELVKKDTCSNKVNVTVINNNTIPLPEKVNSSGLLKIDLESTKSNKTISLYSQVNALPSQSFGTRTITDFNYNVVPDLHVKEYIEKAKRHLCVGTALASVGAIAYASTWFNEIPTFVEYNGLGAFDPANKYYDHNFHERERLQTLKWVRGGAIVVGAIGGFEVVHGIILLKHAKISLAPERITLRYSF